MIHLPSGARHARPDDTPAGTWVGMATLEALGVTVRDLGGGRVGLCPETGGCVPVHEAARRGGVVDLGALAEALGLVVVDDGTHAVVRRADGGAAGSALEVGDELDLTLPDLEGRPRDVVPRPGRGAVFAWASW